MRGLSADHPVEDRPIFAAVSARYKGWGCEFGQGDPHQTQQSDRDHQRECDASRISYMQRPPNPLCSWNSWDGAAHPRSSNLRAKV
jgi:hypothetical protein